jgi:NADH dehydrogenase [ubiquinone] 1 alpha subcomplex assembly factor 7
MAMAPTPLDRRLAAMIRADGPLPFARVMDLALADPEAGYYIARDPLGAAGDFVTAPEISQVFGELIGLWMAVTWQAMGAPDRVVLAELGPGRGTLMADLLRAAATLPAFRAALRPWLVETSPALRHCQRRALEGSGAQWADRAEDLPPGPLLLVANEFFDALPVAQYVKRNGAWHQRLVGLDDAGAFVLALADRPETPAPALAPAVLAAPEGAIAELCPEARRLSALIGARLTHEGGAALIIDYGHAEAAAGDTVQAVRRHRYHPVLAEIGSADITAHVDFAALAQAAAPARAWGPTPQGEFLRRLGIRARTEMLARDKPAKVAEDLFSRMRRLIEADEMGTLFKVLALTHPAMPAPPGLDPR